MKQIYKYKEVEYRDHQGIDRCAHVDLWLTENHSKAVLILHNISDFRLSAAQFRTDSTKRAKAIIDLLHQAWLPYVLHADTELRVMVAQPKQLFGEACFADSPQVWQQPDSSYLGADFYLMALSA